MIIMESDSSSSSITTFSLDVSIAKYIKHRREQEKKNEESVATQRQQIFRNFVEEKGEKFFTIFPGMNFYRFTEKKIKFGFYPSEVAHVSKKVKFLFIMKYTGKYWIPGRNTIPGNLKEEIFNLFYKGKPVVDGDILEIIEDIHCILIDWSHKHAENLRKKIEKYRNKEIDFFELNSEDEELYLSPEERRELYEKRVRILKRMIPPPVTKKRKQLRKKENDCFELYPDFGFDSH